MTDRTDDPGATAQHGTSVGFDRTIGLEFDEAGPDRVVAHFDIAEHLLQPYGIVHGGVYCSVVETCASYGGALWFGDKGQVVGASNHTDFLRAVGSGRVDAVATPIHRGRSQQLWLVELTDSGGRLLARGQVRLQNLTASSH